MASQDTFPISSAADTKVLHQVDFKRLLRRSTVILATALGLPLLALVGLVAFLFNAASWVEHSNQILNRTSQAQRSLADMQSAFRGYHLARQEPFLDSYQIGRTHFEEQIAELAQMGRDQSGQQAELSEIRRLASKWFEFVDGEVGRIRGGHVPIGDASFLIRGSALFNAVTGQFDHFTEAEYHFRDIRRERLSVVEIIVVFALACGLLGGVPALVISVRTLLHLLERTYQRSLALANGHAAELSVTLNSIGDAVVTTDAEGKVTFLNPVAEKIMGWSEAEAKGKALPEVFEIFNEQTGGPAKNPVDQVLRENVTLGLANHTILRARDGSETPIQDSAAPIRSADGEVRGVVLVFHDVSQKHAAEQTLASSERRFRFLNKLSDETRMLVRPVEILEVTARLLGQHLNVSRCAYAEVEENEQFTILHDYTDGCESTVGGYQLAAFGSRAQEDMRNGQTLVLRDIKSEIPGDLGAAAFLSIGIEAIICCPLIKGGRLLAMMAVHQTRQRNWKDEEIALVEEVTDRCWATIERARADAATNEARRLAEAHLEVASEAAERFRLLSEVVALQVWTAAPDGQLDFANQECVNYLGGDLERNILGNAWLDHVHPDDLEKAIRAWKHSLATGDRYEVEFRLRASSGEYRWFLARAQAMRNPSGEIARWFGTNTDIHELKLARDSAEHANRTKDDFLAALSHELRTPLTPVLMSVTYLQQDPRLPADVREQLSMMSRNISLEARLIDDLLDLTSIAKGKVLIRPQPCDIHSLINLSSDIIRDEAELKNLTLKFEFGAVRSGLLADAARLQQVIWNLLRNAVKFTPGGGRITVRTYNLDDAVRVEVTDTGIGISSAAMNSIFLPFDQGASVGHRFGGLGLGLTIARAIVELHGGRIAVKSEGVDRGSTFSIELPGAFEFKGEEKQETPRATSQTKPAKLRVLLVEDHQESREVLAKLLRIAGHSVIAASTLAEARTIATSEPFDLVISDLGLPDGTGDELMAALQRDYGLRGIALSGYGMEEDIARALRSGFAAHLTKPVNFDQLMRTIKDVSPVAR